MASLQYHCAVMLHHRPAARFGTCLADASASCIEARAICVEHALSLAGKLQDYKQHYGCFRTLTGTSLYNIIVTVTVLIANWADHGPVDEGCYFKSVEACLESIHEMKKTTAMARTLAKQVHHLMRRCDFPHLAFQKTSAADDGAPPNWGNCLPALPNYPLIHPGVGENSYGESMLNTKNLFSFELASLLGNDLEI